MSYARYIKEIAQDSTAVRDLSEQEATELFAAMLDGGVPEIELGALLIALRMKSESLSELLGFHAALSQRVFRLNAPTAAGTLPVVLPSYNGARSKPNLLPLLAMLLQRLGVPVLVHGTLHATSRVASAYIFRELGIMPCVNLRQAQDALGGSGLAFVPTAVLSPSLADLLSTRARLGVRSSAHIVAKLLDPFEDGALRVVSAATPAYIGLLREFLLASGAQALLLRSTEGEPFADPLHRPPLEYVHDGTANVLFEAEGSPQRHTTVLPPPDAAGTAAWIRQALAGEVPLPPPIVNQLACCLYAAGYTQDLNQAKAVAAVQTASLAAA